MQLRLASMLLTLMALVTVGTSPSAGASTIAGGGLADSVACPDGASPCSSNADFLLDPPSPTKPATGTVSFGAGTVDLSFSVAAYSMTGSSGSVTALDFSDVIYEATLSILESPLGGGFVNLVQVGVATGSVSGTYDQVGGPGSGPFSDLSVSFSDFNCILFNGEGTCGFNVGSFADSADFGLGVDGAPYDVVQTFNITVPEPGTLALLGLGLVALAVRRAR